MNTIASRFNTIAQAHPDRTALISDTGTLTFAALRERSEQIAHAIDQWFLAHRDRPAGANDMIGVCLDKCTDLYAAVLGILATGAAYVPIDPALPPAMRAHIVATCHCQLLIDGTGLLDGLGGAAILAPGAVRPAGRAARAAGPARAIGTDICYTIFTSGSTGRPKGVRINHGNVLNLVDWAIAEFSLRPGVRVLQYSTIHFDASVLDIFPTLLAGATLCIPDQAQRLSETGLADFCHRHAVSQAFLPPSLLAVLSADRFPGVTTMLTGGESCSPQAIQAWLSGRRLYNLYGPTECTVLVSYKRMDGDTPRTNIGKAIAGVRLLVLDGGMNMATRGELYVAGLAVSPGYAGGGGEAGDGKFLRHGAVDAGVLYKTGDMVERAADGELLFVGRVDRQVKVRGYRVELDEIEGALLRLGYAEAAVKLSPRGALVAYLGAGRPIDAGDLRQQLALTLADFKIPQHFVHLDRFPYKVSGKVDYQALPDQVSTAPAGAQAPLARLWAQELGVAADTLAPDANFRDLGGSSLNIVRLLSRIETDFGTRIDFIDFLDNPTMNFLLHSLKHK